MQASQISKRTGLRLAMLMGGASLAIGSVVWLMVSFWPRPNASLPAEAGIVERPVAGASGPAKAVMGAGAHPGRRATPGGEGQVSGPANMAMGAAGANGNRTPFPLIIPKITATNQIRGPLPWKNGPPVRTPQSGAPAANASQTVAKAPQAAKVVVPGSPGGANSNARGQALPYLPPARSIPHPTPSVSDGGAQKAN